MFSFVPSVRRSVGRSVGGPGCEQEMGRAFSNTKNELQFVVGRTAATAAIH